jgi:Coenzyme PQQ synthesis protein D (PqqD)
MDDDSTSTLVPIFIARESRLAARKVAGEMVILAADDSSLYVLNEIGTLLWEAADGTTPLHDIVDRVICASFEVDADTGLRDARQFLDELSSHGILHMSHTPFRDTPTDGASSDEVPSWAR